MEVIDLNVKAYKRQSPFRMVIVFILGMLVGFALFYMYSQLNPPPKETPPAIPPTSQVVEKQEELPKPSEPPKINEEQLLLTELENTSPFIYILNEEKYSDTTIDMIKQVRPFAVLVKPSQGVTDKDKFLNLLQNIRSWIQNNNSYLPLLAMDLDLNFLQSFPEFQGLPKLSDFNTSTDINKIIEAGTLYAQKIREWGISMLIGPMIELYVTGRIPETEKANYIGDTTEVIQWIGLSFAKGIWQGKVIPVVKNFPSKTLAVKKEINGKTCFALDVDKPGEEGISQLATWLFPFSEAVHQDLPGLLVSHVSIPLLEDENPSILATVSQKIIYGLIRGKWGYDGIIIADDIAEYPLDGTASYADIALQMAGVGINLICISLDDMNEITKIKDIIEQNISKEAKEEKCKRLAKLVSSIRPLPKKEPQESTPPPETTLVAKQEHPNVQETTTVAPSPTIIPPAETSIPPTPQESVITHTPAEITKPESPQESTTPPAKEITKPTEIIQNEPTTTSSDTAPTEPKPAEVTVAQDTTLIVNETKPTPEEKLKEIPSETPKEKPTTESIQKAPQPPGTKAINHRIARGETLYSIAQKYQVKPKDLIDWNGLQDPNVIKYGFNIVVYIPKGTEINPPQQKPSPPQEKEKTEGHKSAPLTIPGQEEQSDTTTTNQPQPTPSETSDEKPQSNISETEEKPNLPSTGETIIYTVKYGDTLDSIAKDMRVSKEEIIQLNNLKKPYLLPAGRKLKVPRVPKVGFN